jgi:hypothetical protein
MNIKQKKNKTELRDKGFTTHSPCCRSFDFKGVTGLVMEAEKSKTKQGETA